VYHWALVVYYKTSGWRRDARAIDVDYVNYDATYYDVAGRRSWRNHVNRLSVILVRTS